MGMFDWFKGKKSASTAQTISGGDSWRTIHEPFTGAWQKNEEIEISKHDQMRHHAVFACVSLISRDIGKLKIQTKAPIGGVKQPVKSKASDLLAKPNDFQTTQQFLEAWVTSKVTTGNAYIWKVRDIYGDIWRMYALNPERVKPLVDENGGIYYQVKRDVLFNIDDDFILPASEIIHDRFNCFYHPLVGLSPITACALSASQGVNIQRNASTFFNNESRPGGLISVPGSISPEKAKEVGQRWRENYSGTGAGNVAVFGDGVEYKTISVSASDAQLVEQLKLSGEIVCTAFSVPAFKIGLGTMPGGLKPSDLNELYYSDCLQPNIESIENLLNENLDLEPDVEVEFNLKGLIRMDSTSQINYLNIAVGGSIMSPNEARADVGLPAVEGGDSPMIQQQNYSLAALAARDAANPLAVNPEPVATNDSEVTDE